MTFPAHERDPNKELGEEDCRLCGINRSICLDTECPGDLRIIDGEVVNICGD